MTVQFSNALHRRLRPSSSADIPLIAAEDIVAKDGTVLADKEARIGYAPAITGWHGWAELIRRLVATGIDPENDLIEVTARVQYNRNPPSCQHRWPADPMSVSRLAERRIELRALIDSKARPARPELSSMEIKQHFVVIADREAHADEWQRLKDVLEVTPPVMSLVEVARCKAANGQAAERQELEAKLATFVSPEHDWKSHFAERSAYTKSLKR